ncbi:MAG: hypothetical protein HMLKMBBP_01504 [Planctomycetes bacterium]|nr:hypothetical protein [Planctomycetota bacterium]
MARNEKQRREFDPERQARCLSKVRYESARIARKRAEARGLPLYHYRCPHCGFWHLTKKRVPHAAG